MYIQVYRANGILIWWDYGNTDGTTTVSVILQPTRVGAQLQCIYRQNHKIKWGKKTIIKYLMLILLYLMIYSLSAEIQ